MEAYPYTHLLPKPKPTPHPHHPHSPVPPWPAEAYSGLSATTEAMEAWGVAWDLQISDLLLDEVSESVGLLMDWLKRGARLDIYVSMRK